MNYRKVPAGKVVYSCNSPKLKNRFFASGIMTGP